MWFTRSTSAARRSQRGMSAVEILIAASVLGVVVLTAATYQSSTNKASSKLKDRAFATQRAIQMMEELRGYVNGGRESGIDVLDSYDDGAIFSTVLTTDKNVTNPGDPTSGNRTFQNGWRFVRQVSVTRLPEAPNARRVQIQVLYSVPGSINTAGEKLAEVVSILKTTGNIALPTQAYDVYILALENVPGWWSNMSTLRPMFDNSISDLESRNPGLEIRRHWITQLGYGRDPNYTPFLNQAANASTGPINWTYFYPGTLDLTNSLTYYDPDNIHGRFNMDGTVQHAVAETDPVTGYTSTPYSLADQWNHTQRYPDELAAYQDALTRDPTLEPSLRLFLEDLNSNPAKYANALIVNLHGEMLPLPPMHNYSDAAKDPRPGIMGGQQYVRAVTHPERLYYPGGDSVQLRVYTYLSNPGIGTAPATTHAFVVLKGVSGNVTVDTVFHLDNADSTWAPQTGLVTTSGSDVVIDLPNSNTRRTQLATTRGLPVAKRLYGMEYIPCPFRGGFQQDLTVGGIGSGGNNLGNKNKSKNTAEWRIKLHYSGNGMLTIETRLGDPVLNTPWTSYPNLSRTYTWIGTSHPPLTEQYQFMGDPRHCPYKDVYNYYGYNWYHIAVDTSDFHGMIKTVSGWGSASSDIDADLPRYYSLWRKGMLNSSAIWTNMTGFSFYYVGMGGEMGADASNGYPNGLPISGEPWNLSGSQNVDEICAEASVNSSRIIAKTDNSWYAMPWLGELYPDDQYNVGSAGWAVNGNLPTGSGNYYRAPYNFTGSPFPYSRQHRANSMGCSSLFDGVGSSAGPFRHEYRDGDIATVMSDGLNLSARFNLGVPTTIPASRPFVLDYGSGNPPEWSDTAYSNTRTTESFLKSFYNAPYGGSYRSSASVRVNQGTKYAWFVMNGLSPQTSSGSAWMARYALISMVQSFMDAGDPSQPATVPQLPRVQVIKPDPNDDLTDPSTLSVTWSTTWTRWDNLSYSLPSYTATAVALHYVLKYSRDGGRTWQYMDDDTPADAGVRPEDGGGSDLHTVSQPFTWGVSALPRGSYIVRLECYRAGTQLHYSYHQVQIYIKRSGA